MDTFHTLAEVAVGFAGFASIAVLFRRRDRGEWAPEDALRYRAMLLGSLVACAFSLLPTLLAPFQMPSSVLWASCSGLLLVYASWRAITVVPIALRVDFTTPSAWVTRLLVILVVPLQAANLIGAPLGRGQALYLAGVGLLLLNAGVNFFRLVAVPAPSDE